MKPLLVLGNFNFLSLGSDPEFFIEHKTTRKLFPSFMFIEPEGSCLLSGETRITDTASICFLKGTGNSGFTLTSKERHGTTQYLLHKDNLLLEGNITPWRSRRFISFTDIIKELKEGANVLADSRGCYLKCDSIGQFPKRFIDTPDGQNFGCRPYLKVWEHMYSKDTITLSPCSVPKLSSRYRTAGFHIHIGYNFVGKYTSVANNEPTESFNRLHFGIRNKTEATIFTLANMLIVKLFDLMIVNPSRYIKLYPERASNYGQFGSYRVKNYGVECRALGGYFTQDKYLPWVDKQVQRLMDHASKLIEYDPHALFNLAMNTKLQLKDKYYIDPEIYKTFGLDHDKEIRSITSIEETIHEKVKV